MQKETFYFMRRHPNKIEIGNTYGQLTVLEWAGTSANGKVKHYWKVVCTCGSITKKRADLIPVGKCADCGRAEQAKAMLGKNKGENNSRYIKDRVEYSLRVKVKAICGRSKYPIELTEDEVYQLIKQECHYCGSLPDFTDALLGKWPKGANGLDRIDSTRHYTKDNTVTCCKQCNYMKNAWTVEEFLNHVEKISRHNKQKSRV